jgi:hypothetical protein
MRSNSSNTLAYIFELAPPKCFCAQVLKAGASSLMKNPR